MPSDFNDMLKSIPGPFGRHATVDAEAVVIGLFGVPSSDEILLLAQLMQELGEDDFAFYNVSSMMTSTLHSSLDTFRQLDEPEKGHWQRLTFDTIRKQCVESGKTAIVVAHFGSWSEGENASLPALAEHEPGPFTHIIYLDVHAETAAKCRASDVGQNQSPESPVHLRQRQLAEKTLLRQFCRTHGILFSVIREPSTTVAKVAQLSHDFRRHNETYNLSKAEARLDEALGTQRGKLETVLVLDADRTLAAEDGGELFWKRFLRDEGQRSEDSPLGKLFSGPMGFSYGAFRQAMLVDEETGDDEAYDSICRDAASMMTMRSEFVSLLREVAEQEHVGAVVVTCGLRRIWDMVLEKEGLSETVQVVGGGRFADGFVVTAAVKAAMVTRLKTTYQVHVVAFGDSPLDLEMMHKADEAIIVVGEEHKRSMAMDAVLADAIDRHGLVARQVVLPRNASPRLDTFKLPLVQITDRKFVNSILTHRSRPSATQVPHTTEENAARLPYY